MELETPKIENSRIEVVSVTRTRTNTQALTKQVVQSVLGEDNEYLQKLLSDKIEGHERKSSNIPLAKLVRGSERERLRNNLLQASLDSQRIVMDSISEQLENSPDKKLNVQNQAATNWILNSVLNEKLKDREDLENSDYWKYINGGLAVILPIVTWLIEHYLTSYSNCSCSS